MQHQEDLIGQLQARLDQIAVPKTKEWWEKYMHQVIPFRGVGIPDIRKQLANWREECGIATWPKVEQLRIALQLFASPIAEDKLAGILFLQDYLYDQFAWPLLVAEYEQLYAHNLIFDWNTCDWFCVRVLGPTIATHGLPCAQALAAWSFADHLWQARSAVVAFVPVAAEAHYYPLILQSCAALIQRDERFAKTAVGWILREMSKYDAERVRGFVEQHLRNFSVEALKNALKYFDAQEQQQYLQRLKSA